MFRLHTPSTEYIISELENNLSTESTYPSTIIKKNQKTTVINNSILHLQVCIHFFMILKLETVQNFGHFYMVFVICNIYCSAV